MERVPTRARLGAAAWASPKANTRAAISGMRNGSELQRAVIHRLRCKASETRRRSLLHFGAGRLGGLARWQCGFHYELAALDQRQTSRLALRQPLGAPAPFRSPTIAQPHAHDEPAVVGGATRVDDRIRGGRAAERLYALLQLGLRIEPGPFGSEYLQP